MLTRGRQTDTLYVTSDLSDESSREVMWRLPQHMALSQSDISNTPLCVLTQQLQSTKTSIPSGIIKVRQTP